MYITFTTTLIPIVTDPKIITFIDKEICYPKNPWINFLKKVNLKKIL